MAFKMKGAPMHDLSSKHGTNTNYKKSGAPGLLGKIMDPLGIVKKGKQMLGGKDNCPPAQAAQAQVGAAKPAEPVAPAAPAAPAAPEEAAAPTMMKKGLKNGAPMAQRPPKPKPRKPSPEQRPITKKKTAKDFAKVTKGQKAGAPMKPSPAKGKMWDAIKKGDFKGAGKTLKHEIKGIGAGVKESLKDNYNTRSNANDIMSAYRTAKNKSAKKQKMKEGGKSYTPELKSNKSTSTAPPSTAKGKADLLKSVRRNQAVKNKNK